MNDETAPATGEKPGLHPRNRSRAGYDFDALIARTPSLARYLRDTPAGRSIDFSVPAAVKALNKALLNLEYGFNGWDLPTGYLCPPVPGRADYLHHLADLLGGSRAQIPTGGQICGLDVGTGASGIYSLIGHAEYGWHFVASDIDRQALDNLQGLLARNPAFAAAITPREQTAPQHIFTGLLRRGEHFDFTLCNPPFHASPEDVEQASRRKWKQLGKPGLSGSQGSRLNFAGKDHELWYPGGERAFIELMIEESKVIGRRCLWFTSLVSRADNLPVIEKALQRAGVREHRVVDMAQGQKKSRFVAWTFMSRQEHTAWRKRRWSDMPPPAAPL